MKVLFKFSLAIIFFNSCITMQELSMFEEPPLKQVPENVAGFYGLEIYQDELNNDFWHTKNPECYQVEEVSGISPFSEKAMKVSWDKDKGVCTYIGMGFGWNGWMSKDMSNVYDSAALSMYVKPLKGQFTNLPVAFAFEDYSGKQAWLGFTTKAVVQSKAVDGWVKIELPISEFNWKEQQASLGNIKQLIIQLEAVGDFYFDEIKIEKRIGGFSKRYHASYDESIETDIPSAVWETQNTIEIGDHIFQLTATNTELKMKLVPNSKSIGAEKSSFEMYIRSVPGLKGGINRFASYDRKIEVDFSKNKPTLFLNAQELHLQNNWFKLLPNDGFELEIPLSAINMPNIQLMKPYYFDIAVSNSEEKKIWNSSNSQQLKMAPYSWGELVFIPTDNKTANK